MNERYVLLNNEILLILRLLLNLLVHVYHVVYVIELEQRLYLVTNQEKLKSIEKKSFSLLFE
jgi:hypothetical protein